MLKDLKLAICSAAVASASFSQAGVFGYGAVVAIAAALLSALGRAISRSLHLASSMMLSKRTSIRQEHCHVQIRAN